MTRDESALNMTTDYRVLKRIQTITRYNVDTHISEVRKLAKQALWFPSGVWVHVQGTLLSHDLNGHG
ncbi:hypothetical protein PV08_03286 [Exophiala spinifera]|uniref:Uncharacterized protein n=1 Tax=Exophiala spinifera TaxID=91928 RepID=A0A0D1YUS0_9EURO|nr:uncharacterized protein PV08_03286 [Exophiala spinifera]KIW18996.1 hypothetical protein PV08_03286 [Exophiala spinifera]